jgi:nucleotide-binding universal stress UspA family protein
MPTKVLVGTDGSATATMAVDRAVEVAKAARATLTVISVGPPDLTAKVVKSTADRYEEAGVRIETRVASGDPWLVLVEEARAGGFDLLVVGNRGMTGVTRVLHLGSVPNKVMHAIPCDLLVVKTT